jgi:hypothetical protein
MFKEYFSKRRMAKAQRLLDQLNSAHLDSVEAILSGERGNVLRKLRGLYVECRRIFMDRAFYGKEPRSLANIIYALLNDPHLPLSAANAVQAGYPPWATQADLAEDLLAEIDKRGMLEAVMTEFAILVTEMDKAELGRWAEAETDLPDMVPASGMVQ